MAVTHRDYSADLVEAARSVLLELEAGYSTIQALLLGRGYEQDPRQPFIFHRTVMVHGKPIKVEVDFLAREYEGTGPKHRTQPVHAGRARKTRGCDLAFDLFVETEISGVLPVPHELPRWDGCPGTRD
jgi:hypothetical protein